MSKRIVYCPHCSSQSQVRPVVYKASTAEAQAFPGLKEFDVKTTEHGVEVKVPSVEIEGGPWNGDRYLVEYTADHYECQACNRMFAVQC